MSEYRPNANAKAHRANARDALRGHWFAAVLVGLVGMLFDANNAGSSYNFNLNLGESTISQVETEGLLETVLQKGLGLHPETVAAVILVVGLVQLFVGPAIALGVCRYNLNLIDRREALVDDVLSGFSMFGKALVMSLLALTVMVPVLVLIVVGLMLERLLVLVLSVVWMIPACILLAYSFAMAPYILLEDPLCTPKEALRRSRRMMKGHKAELFWLELSFWGWAILCIFTLGIGTLFLSPYVNAAQASFYRGLQTLGYAPVEDCPVENF